MECSRCHTGLSPGSRFCAQCGAQVVVDACRDCGAELPAEARFCASCGTPRADTLDTDAPDERDVLAVLVVELDAEMTGAALEGDEPGARWATVEDIGLRHGGRIVRRIGERAVLTFERGLDRSGGSASALAAGLALRDTLDRAVANENGHRGSTSAGAFVAVHAGIAPSDGEEAKRADPIADVATRLLAHMRPGQVVATRAILQLHPGQFTTREVEGTPIPAALVVSSSGVRMPDLQPGGSGNRTPFVARDAELALLQDRWARARAGRSQAVLVTGESGIGKTRLVNTMRERAADTEHSWIQCQCALEARRSPFHPIARALRSILGLRDDDADAGAIEILERALSGAGFPVEETMPVFAPLLDITLPDNYPAIEVGREELRSRTLHWLQEWLKKLASDQPTIFVMEDVHWADPSSLDFLNQLIASIVGGDERILLVAIARTEFEPEWPPIDRIALPRFSHEETEKMASAVAGDRQLAGVMSREVETLSEGVPLFVEEFTADLLEAEASRSREPAPVEASMLRRIARVSDPEIARMASVAGLECARAWLDALAEGWDEDKVTLEVDRLVSAGIMHTRHEHGREILRFKHAMVRDALYADLTSDTRRHLHLQLAETLAEDDDGSAARQELIATHFEQAGEAERAIPHYQQAAALAARGSAHAEGVLHLRAALDLLHELHPPAERGKKKTKKAREVATRELELLVSLGPSLLASRGYGDPQVAEVFERAQALCNIADAPVPRFRALYGLSTYHQAIGSLTRSGEIAVDCLALAEEIGVGPLRALSHQRLGLCRLYEGRIEEALGHLERTLALYDPVAHRALARETGGDMGVNSRAYAAAGLAIQGRPDRARQYVRACLADAREAEHPHSLGFALAFCGIVMAMIGDRGRARALGAEAIELAEHLGFPLWAGIGHVVHGWAGALTHPPIQGAVEEIGDALALLEAIGSTVGTATFYEFYAQAQLAAGRDQAALESIASAETFATRTETLWWKPRILRLRGHVLAGRGDGAGARTALEAAIRLAAEHGSRSLELGAASELARLLEQNGETAAGREVLADAWSRFAEGFERIPPSAMPDVVYLASAEPLSGEDLHTATEALIGRLPEAARHAFDSSHADETQPVIEEARTGEAPASPNAELVAALTPRRLEVLRLVAKGLTNREIGGVLDISEHTAKAHVAGLLEALDLSNRTEAAVALREYDAEFPEAAG